MTRFHAAPVPPPAVLLAAAVACFSPIAAAGQAPPPAPGPAQHPVDLRRGLSPGPRRLRHSWYANHAGRLDRAGARGRPVHERFLGPPVCAAEPSRSSRACNPTAIGRCTCGRRRCRRRVVKAFTEYLRAAGLLLHEPIEGPDYNVRAAAVRNRPPDTVLGTSRRPRPIGRKPPGPAAAGLAVFNITTTHEQDSPRSRRSQRQTRSVRPSPRPSATRRGARAAALATRHAARTEKRTGPATTTWCPTMDGLGFSRDPVQSTSRRRAARPPDDRFSGANHGRGLPARTSFALRLGPQGAAFRSAARRPRRGPGERILSACGFGPTVLALAGVPVPGAHAGAAFLGPARPPRASTCSATATAWTRRTT